MRSIVWFRGKDVRLSDHAPLHDAMAAGEVIPLFVLDPYFFAPARAQELPHRMQFLLDAMGALQSALEERGSRLVIVSGKSVEVVPRLVQAWGVDQVLAHRWVEPCGRQRDRRISETIGVPFKLYEGEMLHAPGMLRSGAGKPYAVFTPFARSFHKVVRVSKPLPAPRQVPPVPPDIPIDDTVTAPTCEALGLAPNRQVQPGGEHHGQGRLKHFVRHGLAAYGDRRDRMDLAATSRLSADLKFGTLSPRQVWSVVQDTHGDTDGANTFLRQLVWREFNYSTLWDRPELLEEPFRQAFVGFPWRDDDAAWQAWVAGKTGYPVVDAAARQLLDEGFVHNRARMLSASFLTKHLLIHYQRGEAHYMKYLTDGDWANNNAGWQWSAGCGCDAQPYFRVFNPITQGEKFDPNGDYVRRWLPELKHLPARYIHRPWEAPDDVGRKAGVRLGQTYPYPIIEHRFARERFLAEASKHLSAVRGLQK